MINKEDYITYFRQVSNMESEIEFIMKDLLFESKNNETRQKLRNVIADNHKHIKVLKNIIGLME